MTYAETLKDPRWQRKRLEMLQSANFECNCCGANDKTLHVHHRQYFKGRMVWDYGSNELDVLCEDCHKEEHAYLDGLKTLLSEVGAHEAFALLAGFHHHSDWVDADNISDGRDSNPLVYAAGFIAWMVQHLSIDDMDKVASFASSLMNESAEPKMVYEHNSDSVFGRADA